jgi:hypothetical protein
MQLFSNKLWRKKPRIAQQKTRNKQTMILTLTTDNHFSFKAYQILVEL